MPTAGAGTAACQEIQVTTKAQYNDDRFEKHYNCSVMTGWTVLQYINIWTQQFRCQ